MPKIANFNFNANFFNFYMKNKFGESFSHSSLAFEKVFTEGNLIAKDLKKFVSLENIEYALKLDSGTPEEKELYGQRFNEVKKAHSDLDSRAHQEIVALEISVEIVSCAPACIKEEIDAGEYRMPVRTGQPYIEVVDDCELCVVCPAVVAPDLASERDRILSVDRHFIPVSPVHIEPVDESDAEKMVSVFHKAVRRP